jgi:deazaflavin-dependent oxidoreductase (nitroreductase family)
MSEQAEPRPAALPAVRGRTPRNTIRLGPRSRKLIRAAARVVNPLVLRIAGRRHMPILGIVHHRGRKSGHMYATPLGVRPTPSGGFVVPLTFSDASHWYQNMLAAGSCVITYRGVDHTVGGPTVVGRATAGPAYPRYERLVLRLIGVNEFVLLTDAPLWGACSPGPVLRGLWPTSPKRLRPSVGVRVPPAPSYGACGPQAPLRGAHPSRDAPISGQRPTALPQGAPGRADGPGPRLGRLRRPHPVGTERGRRVGDAEERQNPGRDRAADHSVPEPDHRLPRHFAHIRLLPGVPFRSASDRPARC